MSMRRVCGSALVIAVLGTSMPVTAAPLVFAIGGSDPASIQGTVDAFRAELGALNPNPSPGVSFPGGRREINWDGVPNGFAAPNNLPAYFFNANSARGSA